VPVTLWVLRAAPLGDLSVWAVFQTHREAAGALSLCSPRMSVAPALEADLEPFSKLKSFELASNAVLPQLYMNPPPPRFSSVESSSTARAPSFMGVYGSGGASITPEDYTISSNPPNPRTNFRPGDWICRSQKCAAMNFQRNLSCIGCGCPRSPTGSNNNIASDLPQSPHGQQFVLQQPPPPSGRPMQSPRFASPMNYRGSPNIYALPSQSPTSYAPNFQHGYASSSSGSSNGHQPSSSPLASPTFNKSTSAHPLLTPSGRAFASGGKVQNISSDPLSPCIMYWPDNEPFPEQGQIRPSGLMGVPQPPILNTGNRGPISHQPGDWICLKCNYLNWRRRKVCQTCLPYAEGNGDSISAAVQAERIALLTSVLAQTRMSSPSGASAPSSPHAHSYSIGRSHSTVPTQAHRPFVDVSPPPQSRAPVVHRSQSHFELGSQYAQGYPIYQTPPTHIHQNQLAHSADSAPLDLFAPAPLLPSFLQDIVQSSSPALSPSSTSSADLSFEEYEESLPSSTRSTFSQSGTDSVNTSPLANIWRLDGEESKSLSAFPLPTRRELMGSTNSSRNSSLERLRAHVSSS
ncbi:hypothetical protein C8J57DRAFT_1059462, partial [Mycena rebaudengoi]